MSVEIAKESKVRELSSAELDQVGGGILFLNTLGVTAFINQGTFVNLAGPNGGTNVVLPPPPPPVQALVLGLLGGVQL